jgi:hypothetical protein
MVRIISGVVLCYAVDLIRNQGCFTFVPTFRQAKTEQETSYLHWNYNQQHEM